MIVCVLASITKSGDMKIALGMYVPDFASDATKVVLCRSGTRARFNGCKHEDRHSGTEKPTIHQFPPVYQERFHARRLGSAKASSEMVYCLVGSRS